MLIWHKLKKRLVRVFSETSWYTIVFALFFYSASSWYFLHLAGETALTNHTDFIYWLVVTGSTVGYGDLSPSSSAGKLLVALYIIPLGLSIFALIVGRIATWVSYQWHKDNRGLKDHMAENHIIVMGWNEERTMQLLTLLIKENAQNDVKADIILCVKKDISNPLPGQIDFVKVSSFNRDEDMNRSCVSDAKTILIDNPDDDITMTSALYCSKRNPNAHIVAYFNDESLVGLLKDHCPNVECTPSVAVEMLVKSAFDPGSSLLHHDLLSVDAGQEQYSTIVPDDTPAMAVEHLFFGLKSHRNAIFVGFAKRGNESNIHVNPDFSEQVCAGDRIFYIANKRINHFDWTLFH